MDAEAKADRAGREAARAETLGAMVALATAARLMAIGETAAARAWQP